MSIKKANKVSSIPRSILLYESIADIDIDTSKVSSIVSTSTSIFAITNPGREYDSFDKLVDLVVADRLKESLSGPCLKYCLAIEGKKTLSASELASHADVYDVNYTPDGRYREGTVTSFREANGVNTQHGVHRQVPPSRPSPPEVSKGVANTVRRLGSNSGQGQQSAQTLRKCWTCGSTSHMRSACPRGGRLGSGTGRFQSQSARVDACVVKDAQDITSTPGTEGDTMKVHVNHCVVETPQSWDEVCGHKVKQLCVSYARRMQVMRMAHDTDTAGHFAGRKTRDRIRLNFYWPSLKRDVYSYTSSCVPCQLRAQARLDDHVPITPIVRPSIPFVVCHVDIIGPIDPPSAQGHKWALYIIDDCTRWPAVFLLKSLQPRLHVRLSWNCFL